MGPLTAEQAIPQRFIDNLDLSDYDEVSTACFKKKLIDQSSFKKLLWGEIKDSLGYTLNKNNLAPVILLSAFKIDDGFMKLVFQQRPLCDPYETIKHLLHNLMRLAGEDVGRISDISPGVRIMRVGSLLILYLSDEKRKKVDS